MPLLVPQSEGKGGDEPEESDASVRWEQTGRKGKGKGKIGFLVGKGETATSKEKEGLSVRKGKKGERIVRPR